MTNEKRGDFSMIFKPEDFNAGRLSLESKKLLANDCNEKLEAWLKEQPRVFGEPGCERAIFQTCWDELKSDNDTHQARLVCIKKLEEE